MERIATLVFLLSAWASPVSAVSSCPEGCPARAQLQEAAYLSEQASENGSLAAAHSLASASIGEGAGPVRASQPSVQGGYPSNLAGPGKSRKEVKVPAVEGAPVRTEEKRREPPAWLVYGGSALLGGLQGFHGGGGFFGIFSGAAAGLAAAYFYTKHEYATAIGITVGTVVGNLLGGPIGGLAGAVVGGLLGCVVEKWIR